MPVPIVLIGIDENSRLRVLQTVGVRVAFVDQRVDRDVLTIMPEVDQETAIFSEIDRLQLISPKSDDPIRTARATILRIAKGGVPIAKGPTDD